MFGYATAEVFSNRGLLGQGASGIVVKCTLQVDGSLFEAALKEARVSLRVQETALKHEALLLQALQNTSFVPRLYAYGRLPHYEYIAMEKCEEMFPYNVKLPMEVPKVFDLAFDIMNILEELHKRDILHGDIKPQNILLRPARAGVPARTVLCDFGLSRSLARAAMEEDIHTVGTSDYTSLASHAHKALGASHDLEQLAYVLLYLLRGNLPWKFRPRNLAQSRAQYLYLPKVKAAWSGQALSVGYPSIFGAILDYARSLPPRELPRYDLIRKALQEAQDGREDAVLAHDDGRRRSNINTDITEEDIALLPTLTDKDRPVIDPTINWKTIGSPKPGCPPPSNSFSEGDIRNEFGLPHGERDPLLSLPEGMRGQLTEVWNLIQVKEELYVSDGDST
ncbi:kinase-like protein [Calocera viscosa TUFC12733]|uniref:non-specific serine/threonine protein kinase n=1 Tax=Calocera viscosa (strain TUFC12733) TaxID=1330018 RepID=A0A167QFJ7_CALVF|nr:kinase-like protein [Calocera viscosa TUFC12733]